MFVYRIEFSKSGLGIYRDNKIPPEKIKKFTKFYIENHERFTVFGQLDCSFYDEYYDAHPQPISDPGIGRFFSFHDNQNSDWRFAFKDTEQLLNWFPVEGLRMMKELDDKKKHGIVVSVYEVDTCHSSKFQTIYNVNRAIKRDEFSLGEFIELVG